MSTDQQQKCLNLLAECLQRLSNHCQGGLSTKTASVLVMRLARFMSEIEDSTGMKNIQEDQ